MVGEGLFVVWWWRVSYKSDNGTLRCGVFEGSQGRATDVRTAPLASLARYVQLRLKSTRSKLRSSNRSTTMLPMHPTTPSRRRIIDLTETLRHREVGGAAGAGGRVVGLGVDDRVA